MCNLEIRKKAKQNGVMLWEIANKLGIADNSFSRMLRKEFNEEKKQKCLSIIEQIKKERE